MTHIDRSADKRSLLDSFFSGATKTGLFETMIVSLGGLAISLFLFAAFYMPLGMELPTGP